MISNLVALRQHPPVATGTPTPIHRHTHTPTPVRIRIHTHTHRRVRAQGCASERGKVLCTVRAGAVKGAGKIGAFYP
jgi:hypothetical protein